MKMLRPAPPKRIGFVAYPRITALDLVGPIEAFTCVQLETTSGPQRGYEVVVLGLDRRPIHSESGLVIEPHATLAAAPPLDTILVPGGAGLREPGTMRTVARWIRHASARARRVGSICTGLYALAVAGLLDGRRATTHWRFVADVKQRFPRIKLEPGSFFTKDGKYYTSGGISSSVDLALALIEEDYGPGAALAVARELVVHLRRNGGQGQYAEPHRILATPDERLAELLGWIGRHLDENLTVELLAQRAGMSARHFGRLFRASQGETPAEYVENARLGEACRRLTSTRLTIDQLAPTIGFHSADAFRRVFQRKIGVAPTQYRYNFTRGQVVT